jgi:actin-related protein
MVVLAIDLGTFLVRAGVAGTESPSFVEPAVVGLTAGESSDTKKFPMNFNERRKDCVPLRPISNSSSEWLINRDALETVLDAALFPENRYRHIAPVIFSLPVNAGAEISRIFIETLFEYCEVPAVFAMRSPALSAFAFGRTSSLVADVGASNFQVSRVVDGCVTETRGCKYAGDFLDSIILKKSDQEFHAYYPRIGNGLVTDEFWQQSVNLVVQDVKHSVCRTSLLPLNPPPDRMRAAKKQQASSLTYKLPDNSEIDICKYFFFGNF